MEPSPPETRSSTSGSFASVALVAAVVIVVAAAWLVVGSRGPESTPPPSAVAPSTDVAFGSATVSPSSAAVSAAPSTPRPTAAPPERPFAASGSIAVVEADGSLSLVDRMGHVTVLAEAGDATFAFPAWSPDGSRIATIRYGSSDRQILVFDAREAAAGKPVEPVVLLQSAAIGPFYLSWTPDGRSLAYLADENGGLSLRIVAADGSEPLDGSAPGSVIRTGNPFYFDWIGSNRMLAHVGSGTDAFLGEIGLDGASAGGTIQSPGDFRAGAVSGDQKFEAFVQAGESGAGTIVVAGRGGSTQRTMPVFGTAAVSFDPTGDTVASIGPNKPGQSGISIPFGPLRLLDPASGKVRTLLDGSVVSFWWSPNGKTIAALLVQPAGGSASPAPASSVSPSAAAASPTASPSSVHVVFVDVASGKVRSEAVVNPGQLYIDQYLTYFDQYERSHRVWSPDSTSLLVPVVDADGGTHIAVLFANGDAAESIDGLIGFWSR
jgi:TolB protein